MHRQAVGHPLLRPPQVRTHLFSPLLYFRLCRLAQPRGHDKPKWQSLEYCADDGLKRAKVEAEGEEREQPLNGGSGSGAEAGTAPGAAPLPAFLQKLKLAAIYGKGEKAPIASEEDKDCD